MPKTFLFHCLCSYKSRKLSVNSKRKIIPDTNSNLNSIKPSTKNKTITTKTLGNYNNELGLPLTIFGIEPEDRVVVLEMGMSHFGEISYLTMLIAGLKRMVLKLLSCLTEHCQKYKKHSAKNKTDQTFGWMRIQHIWRGLRGVQFLVHSGLLHNQSSRTQLFPHQRVGSLEGRQVRVEEWGAVSRSSSKIQGSFTFRRQNNTTCCFHLSAWRK